MKCCCNQMLICVCVCSLCVRMISASPSGGSATLKTTAEIAQTNLPTVVSRVLLMSLPWEREREVNRGRPTDRWMDEWMERDRCSLTERERDWLTETDGRKGRERRTDWWTEKRIERERERVRDRMKVRLTDIERERDRRTENVRSTC